MVKYSAMEAPQDMNNAAFKRFMALAVSIIVVGGAGTVWEAYESANSDSNHHNSVHRSIGSSALHETYAQRVGGVAAPAGPAEHTDQPTVLTFSQPIGPINP